MASSIACFSADTGNLDEELEELCVCEFQDDAKEEKEQIKKNRKLANKLIKFCIRHFNGYKPNISLY